MALTEEDEAKVKELIKSAFGSEDFTKAVGSTVETTVGKAIKGLKLEDKIGAAVTAGLEKFKAKPEGDGDGGEGGEGGGKKDPELERLKAQLKAMADKQAETERRAKEAEEARKTETLRAAVKDGLAGAGADAKRLGIALSHLQANGAIKLDDQGRPSFVFRRDWGEELVPVEKGAAEWLQTDEGKFFLPATNRSGTGDDAGKAGGGGNGVTSVEAILGSAMLGG